MTDQQKTYDDSRDGLAAMLVDCDAGFALYKRQHWDGRIRDVIGPWLDAHDEAVRKRALDERERRLLDFTSAGEIVTVAGEEEQEVRVDRTAPHEVVITHFDDGTPRGWLYIPPALAASLGRELVGVQPVRTEYRAVYPRTMTADSDLTARVLEDEEDAEGLAGFINRRLANWGLPEAAVVETRELFAGEWTRRD